MNLSAQSLHRPEVRPFTDKQIDLLANFAAQAVIAIENARLLNELRQRTSDLTERTADLTEALEQQTATSEVLQVISSAPGDLQLVFQAMLEKAVRICDAKFGSILRWHDDAAHLIATHNAPPAFTEARRRSQNLANPKTSFGRMVATKAVVHVANAAAEPGYVEERDPAAVAAVEIGGQRTALYVPMLKETELVGALTLSRQEVRPFTDKQIELVKNFAAQAVIAFENARLLNELRQRTDDLSQRTTDLTEALEQQTATSEVLRVISTSPGDLKPVFETMLANAAQICEAHLGGIYRWDGEFAQLVATTPVLRPAYAAVVRYSPFRPDPKSLIGRSVMQATAVQFADFTADELYTKQRDPFVVATVELGGFRTGLFVPMLKENEPIGFLALVREDVRLFTDKQIALVENFAAQAVIALLRTHTPSQRIAGENGRGREAQRAPGTARHRPSGRNRTHEQVAPLPASAGG
jgi:GAF domain-containing protein